MNTEAIYHRISELDRLYLIADRASWDYFRCTGSAQRKESLRKAARKAWRAYEKLRDQPYKHLLRERAPVRLEKL